MEQDFITACANGQLNIVKKLISNIDCTDELGNTGLMNTVKNRQKNVFNFLLKNGANIDAQNNDGDTALMIAVIPKYNKWKIDINNVKSYDKESARIRIDNDELVKFLIDNQANLNIQNKKGRTASIIAVEFGASTQVITYLYEKGADFCIKSNRGFSTMDCINNRFTYLPKELEIISDRLDFLELVEDDDQGTSFGL